MQSHHIVFANGREKLQLDTKLAELNGYNSDVGTALNNWKWELAAGKKRRFLTI